MEDNTPNTVETSKNNTLQIDMGMLLLTVIWGFGFITTRIASEVYTTNQILFYRFFISAVVMFLIFWKELRGVTRKELFQGAVLGLSMSLAFMCQTQALFYTTVSKNAFLTTLNVIFVPIIVAIVHKKKIDGYSIAGCLLAIVGTGVLSLNMDFSINLGDVLSILCALLFSIHLIFLGEFARETKTSVLATWQIVFAAIVLFFTSLFARELKIELEQPKVIMCILYLAVICTSFSYLLQTHCQKYTTNVKAVVVFSLEAVFASLFAIIIFGDAITPRFLAGSSLIFIAVIVSSTKLVFLRVLTNRRK